MEDGFSFEVTETQEKYEGRSGGDGDLGGGLVHRMRKLCEAELEAEEVNKRD